MQNSESDHIYRTSEEVLENARPEVKDWRGREVKERALDSSPLVSSPASPLVQGLYYTGQHANTCTHISQPPLASETEPAANSAFSCLVGWRCHNIEPALTQLASSSGSYISKMLCGAC
jgi:hypothetical protein